MEVVKIEAYKFEELSDKAKEKARDWWREANAGDPHLSDEIEESFKAALEERGLPGMKIYFSLGYCQGDGMCFSGRVDLAAYLETNNLKTEYAGLFDGDGEALFEVNIEKSNSHYSHWNAMSVSWGPSGLEYDDKAETLADEFVKHLDEYVKEISRKLEREGYEMIEYENSDEFIDDALTANEYLFTEAGSRTATL